MIFQTGKPLSDAELIDAARRSLENKTIKKALLLPPDYTRMYSGGGRLCAIYYELLKDGCEVDVMPALGTHDPMTREECEAFFGGAISFEKLIAHNWRSDVIKLGVVPGEFVSEASERLSDTPIDVEVNRRIADKSYDLIVSIGQVVPHEVAGMANYSKNIFVGCGGSSMINGSHMLGAFYGMEKVMGRDFSPVRKVFDYAEEHFLKDIPILYVMTVTTNRGDDVEIQGLYIGRERPLFESAVAESQNKNITFLDAPLEKVVVNLDEREFKSTWLGNKAVYRTRMAMAEGGELVVLAKGVKKFGEDAENDKLIRKYGYTGRENVLKLVKESADLRENLSVAAHLIHGSSDGKFKVTYATELLTKKDIEGVGYEYSDYNETVKKYDPDILTDGYNILPGGERVYYISNPALGLWKCKN
ncbi:MAG: lactate racemase domain-containing protein [Oscillospiraceae bacterium]|nr:lactate racemase domain-containing protein [Oscillospiraceae bacterium]